MSEDDADEVVSTGSTTDGEDEPHDDEGLELARTIAKSLAGAARSAPRRRTRKGTRPATGGTGGSGAHPDDRDPQLLDSTLGRLVADRGWAQDLRVHAVFGRWPELVGEAVAEHCRPTSFSDGKLVVQTDSTAWATQLRMLAPTVVRRLNEELGHGTVTLVEIEGPNVPSWKKGRLRSSDGRGPRDTYG